MKIQILHLDEGIYPFSALAKPKSLDLNEDEFDREVWVQGEIEKRIDTLYFRFRVSTEAQHACDRCLTEFRSPMNADCAFIGTSNQSLLEHDEDLRFFSRGQAELDITTEVRDSLLLAVPLKFLCKEDCKGICPMCGSNLNEAQCDCKTQTIDPRWNALRKIAK